MPSLPRTTIVSGLAAWTVLSVSAVLWSGCAREEQIAVADVPDHVEFNAHVRPILVQNCTACHGGVKAAGGVSFIYGEEVLARGDSGRIVVKPGSPGESEMIRRITSTNELERMPPVAHGDALSPRDVSIIRQWIEDGAQWEEHWAYVDPVKVAPETAPSAVAWGTGEIDDYILAGMAAHGLQPNEEQDRGRLLRRLSLDLIGLPPTWEQVQDFVQDERPDAYARQVDRLLNHPGFGERWATPWLDLARYADTGGFERDPAREVWPWRDWVIDALNGDMPFDEFTRLQLAGDMSPEPALADLVATGFHRNTKTNVEGGSDDEEFRIAAVIDRVNTTWQAWMGTTFSCVQCHSHPYDPIPHESYFEFMALFDNTWDHNLSNEYPTLGYAVDPDERAEAFELLQRVDTIGREYQEPFRDLEDEVAWAPLDFESATSTRGITFGIERDENGHEILQTGPNVPRDVVHTVTAVSAHEQVTALRLDALRAVDASIEFPGTGFVLSYVHGQVVHPDGERIDVCFQRMIPDEFGHSMWPEESLNQKSSIGWGAYPKQHYDRWAVLVPLTPIELGEGSQLELELHGKHWHDGAAQPILRRFKISTSDDPRWTDLNDADSTYALHRERRSHLHRLDEIEMAAQPVMRSRNPEYPRYTNMFLRGDWRTRGERVQPGVPPILKPQDGRPIDSRIALAEWLVSEENPLTSRFTVNRHWEQLFGRGLMETLEDFGSASPPPSHPELLDYLALKFRGDWGWSVKRLVREIVMTSTYRQSAATTAEAAGIDPRNIWLSRGPRNRLTAEMVRDNALSVAGLLSDKMHGPPVMPEQPEGVWRSPYNKEVWETSEGEDRLRRAIYTFWKRTVPYPSIMTFDAPSRDVCSPRRIATNTPLQALVTLNDPVYWECADQLAEMAQMEGGATPADWITHGFTQAVLREPDQAEVEALVELYDELLADDPAAPALQLTMNAVLNLDAFLTK